MLIEVLLITVIAGVFSLSFSNSAKLAIGDWWYPEFSWKIVGIIFAVLAVGLNLFYFLVLE
ncbi:MAG: hypothetical protein V1716_04640 [Candidatus Uhrbacteria bacterium]